MIEFARNSTAEAKGRVLEKQSLQAGLSLVFAVGDRPSTTDIERLLESASDAALAARVVHRPDDSAGWLELLASGLSFDLTGLAPQPGTQMPDTRFRFGIEDDAAQSPGEAITLLPGPHLAGGSAMLPVVRTMVGLAAALALGLPAKAVCWHPAGSCMEPRYFAQIVANWLSGGAFPALGLTAIERIAGGGVQSVGLRFFTGQEVFVDGLAGEAPADTVKLAVRIIDYLVSHGPLSSPQALQGPSGAPLRAEPSGDGQRVRIWRGA